MLDKWYMRRWQMHVSEFETERLKEMVVELNDSIHNSDCYASGDLLFFESAIRELEKRGINVSEHSSVTFEEVEKDEEDD